LFNNKLSELNIISSAIPKMFQWLFPKFFIAIISLKKGALMSHPKPVKYFQNHILLSYYQNSSTSGIYKEEISFSEVQTKNILDFFGEDKENC
jgi:hypothetical protein